MKEHGGEPIIPFSGALESKLFDMPEDEKAAYLKEARDTPSLSASAHTSSSSAHLSVVLQQTGHLFAPA